MIKSISTILARILSPKARLMLKLFLKRSDYPMYKKFGMKDTLNGNLGKVLFFTSNGLHRTGNLTESMLANLLENSGSGLGLSTQEPLEIRRPNKKAMR